MDNKRYTWNQWQALKHETKLEALFDIANNGFADNQFGTVEDECGWNAIVTASGMTDGKQWEQSFVLHQDNEGFRQIGLLWISANDAYKACKKKYEEAQARTARVCFRLGDISCQLG